MKCEYVDKDEYNGSNDVNSVNTNNTLSQKYILIYKG